ncbi:MAG: DUF1501 domain-containing protein [Verrucomicrobiota bacterium]|nr:DUF1501 domain-containing protein [Verrucomicrobiota bacterium]
MNTLAHLQLMNSALAQSGDLSDYKALVVLFKFGGNDANNMLIPRMGHAGYADYKASRGILRILDSNDPDYVAGSPASIAVSDGTYGVHPNMQPVANLFNAGRLAFVANVGTLSYPITRAQYLAGSVPVPPQLFSHSDQQLQWQSSVPDQPFATGWGGRVADLLLSSGYSGDQVSLSITIAGINSLQVGNEVVQYAVTSAGAVPLSGYGTNYSLALNADGSYRTTTQGRRLKAFEDIMRYTHQHLLEEGYNEVVRRARGNEALIGAAFTEAAASGVDFDGIFTAANANTSLGTQLRTIARLIAGRNSIANRRQIFFCSVGGYDTHQNQLLAHGNLMSELANSLSAFNTTLDQLGVSSNVLTVTHSDFTRTFTPNGNTATSGSDHGWGGHHVVMGGSVNGGQIYGHFPSLRVNADQDVGGNRGRWIPTTAVDQYAARAAGWMGVDGSAMASIFPNLGRFADPFGGTANLGFI